MKLTKSNQLIEESYRVLIGSKEHNNTGLTQADNELMSAFLETEETLSVVSTLTASTYLVKFNSDAEKMRVLGAKVRAQLPVSVKSLAISSSDGLSFDFLEGFLLGSYQFNKYFKDKDSKNFKLEEVLVEESFNDGLLAELNNIKKAVFWARDMVNEPVSFLNAEQLAREIEELGKETSMHVNVLEKSQIESLKMGGLLAVNQGSIDPPTFSIIEHKPANYTNKQPIVLVGKGVVYDTGGLSLKPTPNSMDIMKSDMGGAAAIAGAIYLAALQNLPLHIIALIPATDNRPGLNAYAPGDVVTMFNGTTVEVLNTDAEGRMILADALSYSKKFNPELVIDAATLTGAAHRAVGEHATIIMGNADAEYFDQIKMAGEACYERTVEFPFWDEYGEELKSPIADLKNLGGPSAGMVTAGKFLENFVEAPYIHMDIAGPAWLDKNNGYRTRGGSGVGVRMVYQFLKNYNNG